MIFVSTILTDATAVAAGAGLLALPFASQLEKLDWHFKWKRAAPSEPDKQETGPESQKTIFNVCAGIMGSALYSSLMFQAPVRWLIEYSWLCWFASFVVAIAIYYGLYVAFGGKVGPGKSVAVLPIALVMYITMFATIATLMAYVFTFQSYYLFAGHIASKAGVAQRGLHVEIDVGSQQAGYDITNRRGFFRIGLKADDYLAQAKNRDAITLSATRESSEVVPNRTLGWKTNTDLDLETSD